MDNVDRYNSVLILPVYDFKIDQNNIRDILINIPLRSLERYSLIVAQKVASHAIADEYYVLKNRYVTNAITCNEWINREQLNDLLSRHEYYSHGRR